MQTIPETVLHVLATAGPQRLPDLLPLVRELRPGTDRPKLNRALAQMLERGDLKRTGRVRAYVYDISDKAPAPPPKYVSSVFDLGRL